MDMAPLSFFTKGASFSHFNHVLFPLSPALILYNHITSCTSLVIILAADLSMVPFSCRISLSMISAVFALFRVDYRLRYGI